MFLLNTETHVLQFHEILNHLFDDFHHLIFYDLSNTSAIWFVDFLI